MIARRNAPSTTSRPRPDHPLSQVAPAIEQQRRRAIFIRRTHIARLPRRAKRSMALKIAEK